MTDLASKAKQAGINITLQGSNFNYMISNYLDPYAPANANKWAMQDFGGETNSTYPTTFGLFNTGGSNQVGNYSNPQADKLINDSITSSDPAAVKAEAAFLTTDQPTLFEPEQRPRLGVEEHAVGVEAGGLGEPDPVLRQPGVLVLQLITTTSGAGLPWSPVIHRRPGQRSGATGPYRGPRRPGRLGRGRCRGGKAGSMISYLARRLVTSIIVVIGVSIFIFLLLHAIYPSPARQVLGLSARPAQIAAWNKANGYDDPVIVQYFRYMNNLLHGNLGYSYAENQSVLALFQERVARSVYLSGISLLIAVVIALPLGIFQAVKRNSIGDNVATSAAFILYSMPSFFLGLILIQVFAISLPIFNFEASQSTNVWYVIGDWYSMTLPIMTLALITVAAFSRYMRSSSMDVLAQDYIKVARAKGLPERLVLWRHLVRNASLPMVTLIGLSLPILLAGNLITEELFNYQGLGLLFFTSLQKVDYPVMLAYTLAGAVLVVVGNLIADIALTIADPRIRLA